MQFDRQLLFFFSAIGAFNGLFLSLYFTFFIKERTRATYFLSALIFVVSVRILKSTFLYFSEITDFFRVSGLTAFALIGPFLFLYIQATKKAESKHQNIWYLHIIPIILLMLSMQFVFPYHEHNSKWYKLTNALYVAWALYLLYSFYLIRDILRKIIKGEKLNDNEIWLTTLSIAILILWLAYVSVGYTSYILGAVSFSFIFYIMLLVWLHKRKKTHPFYYQLPKYANKAIAEEEANEIGRKLKSLIKARELYKAHDLKLAELAEQLELSPHLLSQFLNDKLGLRFTAYINTYRIEHAKKLLEERDHLTLEAIGSECGFKSNSAFYSAFKANTGLTPAQFKKQLNNA